MLNRLTKSVDLRADAKNVTVDERDNGSITAYAATFAREPDLAGDVIAKGAFAMFLARMADEGAVMPLLYNHDQSLGSFIGKVTEIREDDHGLLFTAEFDATEKAQRARELVIDGRLSKFSFAYLVRDEKEITLPDGRLANELRELDVDEVSLVLTPCNPDTSVVDVKAGRRNSAADEGRLREILVELDELSATVRELLGEEPDDHDTTSIDDAADAKGADAETKPDAKTDAGETQTETEGGEGMTMPEGREVEAKRLEAYRAAVMAAYGQSD